MSVADKIALLTVIAAFTPMACYFMARIAVSIILSIYGVKDE